VSYYRRRFRDCQDKRRTGGMLPSARIRTLVIFIFFVRIVPIPALIVLGIWFLMQVLSVPASGRTGVAFFAHIGGFLIGMLLTGLFARRGRRRAT